MCVMPQALKTYILSKKNIYSKSKISNMTKNGGNKIKNDLFMILIILCN